MCGRGGVTRKFDAGERFRKKKRPRADAGPSSQEINGALFLRRVLLAGLVALTALLATLSGVLRLLARLLVRLSALLTGGLATLVLLPALLISILVGHGELTFQVRGEALLEMASASANRHEISDRKALKSCALSGKLSCRTFSLPAPEAS